DRFPLRALKFYDNDGARQEVIAEACSEAWLRRLFLRYTGKTPKEYYLDARLDLALSLLKQQGNSVGEVADTLNFFDSFHFSKAFKHKLCGLASVGCWSVFFSTADGA
ncbi:helix-turn-helix transcriptional regulator, partial [Escherichia sp. TWPC-MK]